MTIRLTSQSPLLVVQLVVQLLVVVLLCSQPCQARSGRGSISSITPDANSPSAPRLQYLLRTVLDNNTAPTIITARTCPGVVGNKCTQPCQLRLCQALADLYHATNNLTDPWDYDYGWDQTVQTPCKQLMEAAANSTAGGGAAMPAYCKWHGVTCCDRTKAADGRCYLLNSVDALNLAINNLNGSIESPEMFGSLKTLHDCGLIILDLESNNIIGKLTEDWGQMEHLRQLNLGTCWLNGPIPKGIRRMQNLTLLNLNNNWFSGSMPQWLPDLKLLRVINLGSQFGDNEGRNEGTNLTGLLGPIPPRIGELAHLRELVLEANSLSGRLPSGLCHKDGGSLLVFNVRNNQLEGPAQEVEDCKSLVQLDISNNMFTGSLPASPDWDQLATYTASRNKFTGRWPKALSEVRILEFFDISHNAITGLIPPKVTLLNSLKSVKLSDNKFSGTVVEDLYYMGSLAVLDLSNNFFVGTTPGAIGLSYSLTELDLSNNAGITGIMTPEMALVPRLQLVKITNTSMSCAGIIKPFTVTTNSSCTDADICKTPEQFGDPSATVTRCTEDQLLPCFLRFTEWAVPREDNSNMKCKGVMRKPVEQAQQDCAGSDPQQLGDQASSIPTDTLKWGTRWEMDPAYYQYQACDCLLGFTESWDSTGTVLTCVPEQKNFQHKGIIIAVVVASAAVLAVAFIVWRQYLRTRPRWLRERLLQGKRSKGAPRASKPGDKVLVSVLVTDVKDFSDLTRRYPELMNKAMGGHNNIMRKACHAHAGHVMDQEGDSWTIAFHGPEDAVAFGLQVEQALGDKVWGLKTAASPDNSVRPRMHSHTTQASDGSASSSYGMMGSGYGTPGGVAAAAAAAAAAAGGRGGFGAGPTVQQAPGRLQGSFSGSEDRGSSLGRVTAHSSRECSFTSGRPVPADNLKGDIELGMMRLPADVDEPADHLQPPAPSASWSSSQLHSDSHAHHADDTMLVKGILHQQQQQHNNRPLGRLSRTSDVPGSTSKAVMSLPLPSAGLSPATSTQSRGLSATFSASSRVSQHSGTSADGINVRGTSRLYTAGSVLVQRLSRALRSNINSSLLPPLGSDTHNLQQLRLSVRIGVATGWLQYGCTLDNCVIKERAKSYISEVANGGQILMDSRTFKLVKHSLSALGTVDENGYNDKQLQQLMQARVVAKLQRHVACGACCSCSAHSDSSSSYAAELAQCDYDTDAIVVHMGSFTAPAASGTAADSKLPPLTTTTDDSTPSGEEDSGGELPPAAPRRSKRASLEGRGKGRPVYLQLYSIAAPRMRRMPQHTQELQSCTAWCQPVRAKQGWVQVQKDYFQAPGARPEDLCPSSLQGVGSCRGPLPSITFVFAEVPGAHTFMRKNHNADLHTLNKAIRRCMLQLMAELTGGDGYMCRCHEPDLKYMVAFESPVRAVQWCLLVQEALMYMDWPEHILSLPGFEEARDPESGQLMFRGPRLRMGVSDGVPGSVLPDHMGHANYTGGAVNRAARFMDVAAYPGQVVCDIQFAQRCFEAWAQSGGVVTSTGRRPSSGSGMDVVSPESIPESAATDWGDPQVSLMQLMALRSQSETSGHCRPATGPQGLRSRALHELWYQQQQFKQEHKDINRRQKWQQLSEQPEEVPAGYSRLDQGGGSSSTAAWHGGGMRGGGGGGSGLNTINTDGSSSRLPAGTGALSYAFAASAMPPRAGIQLSGGSFTRYNPLTLGGAPVGAGGLPRCTSPAATASSVFEAVTASHLGSFTFKGSGVFEMVNLQHAELLSRQFVQELPKGKGMRLSVASGPVTDLPHVQLHIPARLLAARQALPAYADVERE